jgi:rhomboid-related protein 1/2/3
MYIVLVLNSRKKIFAIPGMFNVFSYASQYNCLPPPIFIIGITVAEVIIFGVYAAELNNSPYTGQHVTWSSGVPLYSPLLYCPSRRYEAWRFVTYMFIHQGYYHLISNCFFQLFLGVPLEMVHKWWRIGIIYFLGVMAGSFGMSIFDPRTPLAG